MARPRRIEFAGALYHVTSRGDGLEAIYRDDVDREAFDAVLEVCEQVDGVPIFPIFRRCRAYR